MIKVEIVTPERLVHTAEGVEIILPTVDGQIGVRNNHLPIITLLKPGQVVVKQANGSEELLAVAGGFVEVRDNIVRVLADSAERAEELNEEQIRAAIARAEELKATAQDEHEFADANARITANLARLKVLQRKRSRSHHQHISE